MKKVFFENLDGLRFIAFLGIFLHHGIFTFNTEVKNSSIFYIIEITTSPAGLGVPFFFCLSGFLITYLLLAERETHNKINIGKFYMRRLLRIWPLFYAVVIFGFFVFPIIRSFVITEPYVETATLWKYLLFLSNFDQISNGLPYGSGLGVTWSLAVEEQFYLIWPLLLTIVKPKYYTPLCLTIWAASHISMEFFDLKYYHTFGSMSDLSFGGITIFLLFK